MKLLTAGLALACCVADPSAPEFWNTRNPNRNADRVARLFSDVCVNHLGRSTEMNRAVHRSGAGFRSVYGGKDMYGPVWRSPIGRITATDHRHNHDGDECRIDLHRSVAPTVGAIIAAFRRQRVVQGRGDPAEFGATAFRRGDSLIFVRYDVSEEATGVTEKDAGLMLLIRRPPG